MKLAKRAWCGGDSGHNMWVEATAYDRMRDAVSGHMRRWHGAATQSTLCFFLPREQFVAHGS
jgi:hypothetical protein